MNMEKGAAGIRRQVRRNPGAQRKRCVTVMARAARSRATVLRGVDVARVARACAAARKMRSRVKVPRTRGAKRQDAAVRSHASGYVATIVCDAARNANSSVARKSPEAAAARARSSGVDAMGANSGSACAAGAQWRNDGERYKTRSAYAQCKRRSAQRRRYACLLAVMLHGTCAAAPCCNVQRREVSARNEGMVGGERRRTGEPTI